MKWDNRGKIRIIERNREFTIVTLTPVILLCYIPIWNHNIRCT